MRLHLTAKFVFSFLFVILLIGGLAIWVGVHFIADGILKQAQNKVKSDLNVAREIYSENLDKVKDIIRLTANRFFIREAVSKRDIERLRIELAKIRENEFLDILTLTNSSGRVWASARNPKRWGDLIDNDLMRWVQEKRTAVAGTIIISREDLLKENEGLAELAFIKVVPTPQAKPTEKEFETRGMVLGSAAPIFDGRGNLIGILFGGILLNQNFRLVDKIKDLVFKGETYKGKEVGTATIFLGDVRIATNVRYPDGRRAIGSRVAENVYNQVLVKGSSFIDRAFVVQDWYLTAYEPIRDITGKAVGILYVGISEDKFVDMRKRAITTFVTLLLVGIGATIIVSFFLAQNILRPLKVILVGSRQIAQGDFDYRVKIKTKDELAELGESFNFMVSCLKERDERLKEMTRQQIARSERLATLGQLAAGVAHEINNPISGILTYIYLIKKKLGKLAEKEVGQPSFSGEEAKELERYLEIMEKETNRCGAIVRSLLDFARQSEPNLQPVDVHLILDETLELLAPKLRSQNILVEKSYTPSPLVIADFAQIQQSFVNIILNACEAMEGGGKLLIATRVEEGGMVAIEFTDTGKGIPPENLAKIFDPFFTTKPKGTGLGLSVVYGIIARHQGQIDVKSEVGQGTRFTIKLPIKGGRRRDAATDE